MNEEATSGGRFDEVNRKQGGQSPDECFRQLPKSLSSSKVSRPKRRITVDEVIFYSSLMSNNIRFRANERLKSRKVIARIFQHRDNSIGVYPLRVKWTRMEEPDGQSPVLFSVTAPKRPFPHAVDRNRVRRQVRECWRLQKHLLYTTLKARQPDAQWALMCIFVAKEHVSTMVIEQAMKRLIRKLPDAFLLSRP
jgi:ribonuclease P protein component